ncbi:MAG: DUF1223 domain-containing protein [Phreatobacter sp.]|uniref:DUF1223 domain-containing protein n=1 Tax=Phreatobacter sp. TaxID=1966341 RepID=UPI001A58EDF8|nr:DUF1223 domain-containing protein [Phreatobacter sp.]MBL8568164.1 DUF1223 domain-containing protein [Phreatobacter sp.]
MVFGKACGGLLLAIVSLASGAAVATERPRAVLELFTSQGCSSCPPADRYLADLADRPDVIALTFAVDYWDYLGWRDTLANPFHAKRQKAYAYVRGDRQVYTPQMIVNGMGHAIGSDRVAVERSVTQTTGHVGVLAVPVNVSVNGDSVTVRLPEQTNPFVGPDNPATVTLLGVSSRQPVDISRGENRGQTVTYRNVVRAHASLGEWSGAARTFTVSKRDLVGAECERVVVLIQAGTMRRPGAIIGAAMAQAQ